MKRVFTAFCLWILTFSGFGFGQTLGDYLELRKQNKIDHAAAVSALDEFVGVRILELKCIVKGVLDLADSKSIYVEYPGNRGEQVIEAKSVPLWLQTRDVQARLLVKAYRSEPLAAVRVELIAAAQESDISAFEAKLFRNSVKSSPFAPVAMVDSKIGFSRIISRDELRGEFAVQSDQFALSRMNKEELNLMGYSISLGANNRFHAKLRGNSRTGLYAVNINESRLTLEFDDKEASQSSRKKIIWVGHFRGSENGIYLSFPDFNRDVSFFKPTRAGKGRMVKLTNPDPSIVVVYANFLEGKYPEISSDLANLLSTALLRECLEAEIDSRLAVAILMTDERMPKITDKDVVAIIQRFRRCFANCKQADSGSRRLSLALAAYRGGASSMREASKDLDRDDVLDYVKTVETHYVQLISGDS